MHYLASIVGMTATNLYNYVSGKYQIHCEIQKERLYPPEKHPGKGHGPPGIESVKNTISRHELTALAAGGLSWPPPSTH